MPQILTPFELDLGYRLAFGESVLDSIGTEALALGGTRVLIVTDPGVHSVGHVDRCVAALSKEALSSHIFADVHENPTTADVDRCVAFARPRQIDLIVGLGGGSAMDCAKAANFLLTNGGSMEQYWGLGKAARAMLPSIGVPTTAGTGSEAQSYALIVQESTHRKMACGDRKAHFRTVLLDPRLVSTVPASVMAVTGMDAVSHALESYVSLSSTPASRIFALEAWKLLAYSYKEALESENPQARGRMLWAAHLAGFSIECSMLGAAHACANPLTARFGVTHGAAVALMLPSVIRFNGRHDRELYAELALNGKPAIANSGSEDSSERLAQRVTELRATGGLPEHLRDCRITIEQLGDLAAEAQQEWTGRFNPRPLSRADFQELYRIALQL